jgi:hypothetical protein
MTRLLVLPKENKTPAILMTRLLAIPKGIKTPAILGCTPMRVFEPHGSSALCSSSYLSWR